jgi:hypothetical protein
MPERVLLIVSEFSRKHPSFTEGSLRKLIFESKPRTNSKGETIPGNGLARAIRRIGRAGSRKPRVLIDETEFFAVIDALNDEDQAALSQ